MSADSASLASTQSWRSRASATTRRRVVGVQLGAGAVAAQLTTWSEDGLVEVDAAEVLDALGRAEELEAVCVLRSTVASKVPPPRS